jgi:hypothetical protein
MVLRRGRMSYDLTLALIVLVAIGMVCTLIAVQVIRTNPTAWSNAPPNENLPTSNLFP